MWRAAHGEEGPTWQGLGRPLAMGHGEVNPAGNPQDKLRKRSPLVELSDETRALANVPLRETLDWRTQQGHTQTSDPQKP